LGDQLRQRRDDPAEGLLVEPGEVRVALVDERADLPVELGSEVDLRGGQDRGVR
jgi:hypothetical protein